MLAFFGIEERRKSFKCTSTIVDSDKSDENGFFDGLNNVAVPMVGIHGLLFSNFTDDLSIAADAPSENPRPAGNHTNQSLNPSTIKSTIAVSTDELPMSKSSSKGRFTCCFQSKPSASLLNATTQNKNNIINTLNTTQTAIGQSEVVRKPNGKVTVPPLDLSAINRNISG